MKIVAITRVVPFQGAVAADTVMIPAEFRVGQPVVANGPIVEKILYCRDGVADGEKGRFPSYLVKFEGTEEQRIVPESRVLDIAVVNEGKKQTKNPEAEIELPE